MWRLPKQWDHFSIIMSNIQYQRKVVLCFRMCLVKSLQRQQIIQIQTGTLRESPRKRDSVQCKSLKICYKVKSVTLSLSLSSVVSPSVVYSACWHALSWAAFCILLFYTCQTNFTFCYLLHLGAFVSPATPTWPSPVVLLFAQPENAARGSLKFIKYLHSEMGCEAGAAAAVCEYCLQALYYVSSTFEFKFKYLP